MPQYKLIYFDARGQAELVRWIFAYGGIDYVDERIKQEDWPERKKTLFTNDVPVLMVDGRSLPRPIAIAFYAATLTGLVTEDCLDAAFGISLSETLLYINGQAYKIWSSCKTEKEKKKEFEENVYCTEVEPFLIRLEKWLEGKEWFVGDKMTWTDLNISVVFGMILERKPQMLEQFPRVKDITYKVREIPRIKNWIETSPQTPL